MAKPKKDDLQKHYERAILWRIDPIVWVKDVFGDNLRKAFKEYTGKEPLTETGLTRQQEHALNELGKILYAKQLKHYGEELSEEEEEYASKIGISIQSGTGTGKDFFAALVQLYMLQVFKNCKQSATANTAKQLRNVLWSEIAKVMSLSKKLDPLDPNSLTVLQHEIEWQSERIYIKSGGSKNWFAEAVTISARSTEDEQAVALGGRHEKYMLLVADEASGIPEGVFRAMEGTLTGAVNIMFVIFNPTRARGYAIDSQRDPRFVALHWNSEESEVVSQNHIDGYAKKYGKDSSPYRIRILGLPPLADSNALIPFDWIEDARTREIEPTEYDYVINGCDFGAGGDKSIRVTRKGGKIYGLSKSNTKDSAELEDWVYGGFLRDEGDLLLGDSVGIGWAVMGNLRKRLGGSKVRSIDSRSKAKDDQRFFNKRAEIYWNLREAFEQKAISLSALSDHDYRELADQLGAITYSDETGRIQIVKKSKIKDEIGHSPDEADAIAISYGVPATVARAPKETEMDKYRKKFYESRRHHNPKSWMTV